MILKNNILAVSEFKNLSYEVSRTTGNIFCFWKRKVERKVSWLLETTTYSTYCIYSMLSLTAKSSAVWTMIKALVASDVGIIYICIQERYRVFVDHKILYELALDIYIIC